jgi:hypothetical protein
MTSAAILLFPRLWLGKFLRMFVGFTLAAAFVTGLGAAESGAAPQAQQPLPQSVGLAPQALNQILG